MAADGDGVAVAVVLGDDVEDGSHEDVAFVFLEALVGGGHFETLGEGLDVDAGGGNGSEVATFEDPCVDESFGVDVDSHGGGNDEYVGSGKVDFEAFNALELAFEGKFARVYKVASLTGYIDRESGKAVIGF